MEGDVVMVRLGADEGCIHPDQDQVQASPFVELKPSTTLLVPLELVEEEQDLVDCAQLGLSELQQTIIPDDLRTDSHSGFSLILDMEEAKAEEEEQAAAEAPPVFSSQKAVSVTSLEPTGTDSHSGFSLILDVEEDADRDAHTLSIEKDLLSTDLFSQCPAEEASDEHMTKAEDVLLDPTQQDNPPTGDPSQQAQMKPMDGSDGSEFDGVAECEPVSHQAILETENTEVNRGTAEAEEQRETESLMLPQDQEPAVPAGDEQSTHSLRRSRRLILRSSKVESTPLDTLEDGVLAPPVGAKASETEPALLLEEPIRVTGRKKRQSKRVSLNTLPQVRSLTQISWLMVLSCILLYVELTSLLLVIEDVGSFYCFLRAQRSRRGRKALTAPTPVGPPGTNSGTTLKKICSCWTRRWRLTLRHLWQTPSLRGCRMRKRSRKVSQK